MTAPDNAPSASGLPSPVTLKRSRWLYWGGIVVFVVATALISGWVLSHDTAAQMKTLQDQLAATQPWLLIWRLGLMSVLIGCYPVWVNRVANFLHFHPLQRQYALSQRWPVAIAILLVELVFAQRGLAVLLHWLFPVR